VEARHDEGVANRIGPELCTGTHQQCAFRYRPEGWDKACRFLALRHERPRNCC
jgi:hypothetical protein